MAPSAVQDAVANGTKAGDHQKPVKTREVYNHHSDSRIWNDFEFRDDDIIITTHSKSGTTWTQQIVSQLIHKGDPSVASGAVSPWVDIRFIPREAVFPALAAQTHRRFMKTHLPLDALPFKDNVKYIFIARDGRDMIWSTHNHFYSATDTFYELVHAGYEGTPIKRPGPNPRDLLIDMIEDDTRPSIPWPFWDHIKSYWVARHEPNLLLVHFNDLKRDMPAEMRRIAQFLDIDIDKDLTKEQWDAAVEHCGFQWMKDHAELSAPPQAEMAWQNGAQDFVYKGTNGRWRDVLSEEDVRRYDEVAREKLGEDCAKWLEHGGHV